MCFKGLFSAGALFGESSTTSATVETIVAGVLVGFGTRMGTGCTSGHGKSYQIFFFFE